MKKLAIICIASFYLLLTTGQFVCIVNCSAKWLITALATSEGQSLVHQEGENCHRVYQKDDQCTGEKDCPCCEKHGSYVVKENLKPDADYFASNLTAIPVNNSYSTHYIYRNIPISYKWPPNAAPPPGSPGPDIHVRICTFLI